MRINPTVTSFGTSTVLIDALLAKEQAEDSTPVQIGPGRRTLRTYHKGLGRERYTGRRLRNIRAAKGCGRPPRRPANWTEQMADVGLTNLTNRQRIMFRFLVEDHDGVLQAYKAAAGLRGAVWKAFVGKLARYGLIEPDPVTGDREYRISAAGSRAAQKLANGESY